jgi:hypothetical protein
VKLTRSFVATHFAPSPEFPEPPWPPLSATAEPRRRPSLRLHSGPLPLLGERVVQPGYLPGRDRRRFAGFGRSCADLPGQRPNCKQRVLSRVFRVKVQGIVVKNPKFLCSLVQCLRKFLEIHRKNRKIPNQFCGVQEEKSHHFCYLHRAGF